MGWSWFNTETNKKKTSINNKNIKQFDHWNEIAYTILTT